MLEAFEESGGFLGFGRTHKAVIMLSIQKEADFDELDTELRPWLEAWHQRRGSRATAIDITLVANPPLHLKAYELIHKLSLEHWLSDLGLPLELSVMDHDAELYRTLSVFAR